MTWPEYLVVVIAQAEIQQQMQDEADGVIRVDSLEDVEAALRESDSS